METWAAVAETTAAAAEPHLISGASQKDRSGRYVCRVLCIYENVSG